MKGNPQCEDVLQPNMVVIMRGLPGSGKSTFVDSLRAEGAKTSKPVYALSADQYFTDENGSYTFVPSDIGKAHALCLREFVELVRGKTLGVIVVDNTNTQCWEMAPYVALAQAYGRNVQVIHTKTELSPDALAARNVHGVPAKAIQGMRDRWEDLVYHWPAEIVREE